MTRRLPDSARNNLRILKDLGFGFLEELKVGDAPPADPPRKQDTPSPRLGSSLPVEQRIEVLEEVAREVSGCTLCRLCHGRTNTVPGEGDPAAELLFVGEGPGADEDKQGRPFVGRAGQLLTKIIEAMQFQREDVFIANIVKCRPPGNRQPELDEMETCLPYLRRQIDALSPKVIVTLGKTALVGLLPELRREGITKIRGKWLEYEGIPVMPTFHPAYLLRSPQQKKYVWEDMQEVMKVFGKEPPKPKKGD